MNRALAVLILLHLAGCSKFEMLNATVPAWGYDRTANVAYGEQPRQKLDVYRPCCTAPGAPVIVFFYGGFWQYGSKDDYRFVAQALTSRGFVTVMPDYRLYPSVTFPAFVEDGALAVRWARENANRFGGDPRRIYLMGHSAGAYIVALLTLDASYLRAIGLPPDTVRAAVAMSGPYDFVPGPDLRPVFALPSDGPPEPRVNPLSFPNGKAPPMLLLQGARDDIVDPADTTKLADRIRQAGGDVSVIFYEKRGHPSIVLALAWPFRFLAPVLDDSAAFFRKH